MRPACPLLGINARCYYPSQPNNLITLSPDLLAHMNAVFSSYTRSTWFGAATRAEVGKDHVSRQLDEMKHTKRHQQMAFEVCLSSEQMCLLRSDYASTRATEIPPWNQTLMRIYMSFSNRLTGDCNIARWF
jgi:hypothetical protein